MPTIIKPRKLGILTKVERRGSSATLVVSALGLFSLLEPSDFEPDTALWPMAMEQMPAGTIFDAAMPKPCGEVLVAGFARAAGGEPVPALSLDIALGAVRKRLAVFGDRVWRQTAGGPVFEPPKPFAEMPLVPERCFGGPSHPVNPLGRGMEAARRVDAGEIVLLPNIERADRLIRTAEDAPEPIRLGPIDPAHPSRRVLAGTYDDHWLKHGFPGLAADADPRLFCVATPDQRIEGYFSGQEPYRLAGFSAEHPVIEGALPGLRVRIFIARSDGLFELPNVLDTAWLFPSAHKGVLVYRGACPVADIDGDDVTHVMLAYERLADEPRPVEHYAEAFRLRSDPAEKLKYALADGALSPLPDPAALERRRLARMAHHERQRERTEKAQRLVLRDALDKAGLPAAFMPNLPPAEPPPAWMPSPEEIASGEIDFAALFEGTQQLQAQMDEHGRELEAKAHAMANRGERFRQTGELGELDALLAELDLPEQPSLAATALPPDFKLPPSTVDPEASLREALQRFHSGLGTALLAPARDGLAGAQAAQRDDLDLEAMAADKGKRSAIQLPAETEAADDKLRRAFPDLAPPGQSLDDLLGTLLAGDILPASTEPADPKAQLTRASAQLDQLEPQLGEAMATMRRVAPQPIHPITPLPPEAALRFGQAIAAEKAKGLAGRDMAGADLSGQDFSGLDLSGAFFEQCDLSGARFLGANCTGAVFAGADLRGADFSQANLLEANFGTADARGARFTGADLRRAQWLKSQVAQCDFAGAQLEQANFIETDLSDVSFAGARLDRVTILRSDMARVVLADAVMESCALVEVKAVGLDARRLKAFKLSAVKLEAPGADFSGAHLQQSGFHAGCDLTGARFDGAVGMNGSFRGARLIRASFARASFNRVDFGEADLSEADLALASLKQASLGKAILLRADLFGANLFNAQARRAHLDGARLLRANLYGCDLSDASLVGADLTQALLDKTLFGMPADAP
ncbi:DUF2169 family type VI secretion system accessory protein [Bosea sp. NPDC055332]